MFSGWGLSWGGWLDNRRGEWWLLAQLALITAHLLPPWPQFAHGDLPRWPQPLQVVGLAVLLVGLGLALQAFFALGSSLSPLPSPKQGNALVRSGPYQRCRHPLYQAVLISSCGVAISLGSLLHLALLLSLCFVLHGKARREETDLIAIHPDYNAYRAGTPAILPHIPLLDWRS